MSLNSALMARASEPGALQNLIDGRIAVEGGLQNWPRPYVVWTALTISPQHTFKGPPLVVCRVEATLYAASGVGLDELEGAWIGAFSHYSGTVGGEKIQSWITSSYDENLDELETDSQARSYARVVEMSVAYVPA